MADDLSRTASIGKRAQMDLIDVTSRAAGSGRILKGVAIKDFKGSLDCCYSDSLLVPNFVILSHLTMAENSSSSRRQEQECEQISLLVYNMTGAAAATRLAMFACVGAVRDKSSAMRRPSQKARQQKTCAECRLQTKAKATPVPCDNDNNLYTALHLICNQDRTT
eukprot:scaffold25399_cov152-Skeletonema_marinoi.AAC.1